jgi:hypothetical protein
VQIDGQPIIYTELFKVQFGTGFRNFQAGIDNVTTELFLDLSTFYFVMSQSQSSGWNYATLPYAVGGSNYDDYLPNRLVVEVSPDANFSSFTVIEEWGIDHVNGYKNISKKITDSLPKTYQNPWYRCRHFIKKTPNQNAGANNGTILLGHLDLTLQAWNKIL